MESPLQFVRYFLITLGACLLIAGSVLLLWFGQMVYLIVTGPEQVRIIQFILEHITVDGPMVWGASSGEDFELSFSESAKTFCFFFLGVCSLSVLAGIAKSLLSGGVEIIKGALAIQAAPDSGKNSATNSRFSQTHKN